ncbi:MAG TPA: DegV family protein [Symbiobacteriaceae bacterium]|nr:DegV family protein [Symbiobacteriaceae bacterium]
MSEGRSAVIVADGGVDLPEGYARQYGIKTIPLMVCIGDEQLRSGVDISAAEFYRRLRLEKENFPTTSQPSAGDYVELYTEAAMTGLPILSFHLSAGLSGSLRSAQAAKEMLPDLDIHLIDTGTLSGAMGLQVLVAAEMAAEGVAPERIVAEAKRIGEQSDTFYTIDTLEYLRRGGRIGRVAGYVGTLLGLRPIITVDKATGTYNAVGRTRSFKSAANQIVDTVIEAAGEGSPISVVMLHGDCEDEVRRMLERLSARMDVRWVKIMRANPALGAHIGPDTVGLAYYRGVLPIAEAQLEAAQ